MHIYNLNTSIFQISCLCICFSKSGGHGNHIMATMPPGITILSQISFNLLWYFIIFAKFWASYFSSSPLWVDFGHILGAWQPRVWHRDHFCPVLNVLFEDVVLFYLCSPINSIFCDFILVLIMRFVCLFMGMAEGCRLKLQPPTKWVSLRWDLASRPKQFYCFLHPDVMGGYKDGEKTGLLLPKTPSDWPQGPMSWHLSHQSFRGSACIFPLWTVTEPVRYLDCLVSQPL